MATVHKGSAAENYVARDLEAKGFVVASRRHIGGAGDLLAVRSDGLVYLVEVKARKNVYQGFRKADRLAMKEVVLPTGGAKFLANVRGSGTNREITYVPESHWPK